MVLQPLRNEAERAVQSHFEEATNVAVVKPEEKNVGEEEVWCGCQPRRGGEAKRHKSVVAVHISMALPEVSNGQALDEVPLSYVLSKLLNFAASCQHLWCDETVCAVTNLQYSLPNLQNA